MNGEPRARNKRIKDLVWDDERRDSRRYQGCEATVPRIIEGRQYKRGDKPGMQLNGWEERCAESS
jgi:hypothetical protein